MTMTYPPQYPSDPDQPHSPPIVSGPPVSPGPYPPPYGYPPPVVVVQPPPTSGVAVASMVLGLIGALGGWCMLGIPCAIAILLGHAGLAATKDGRQGGRGLAITGLILGYLFVVPWALLFFMGAFGTVFGGESTPTPTP